MWCRFLFEQLIETMVKSMIVFVKTQWYFFAEMFEYISRFDNSCFQNVKSFYKILQDKRIFSLGEEVIYNQDKYRLILDGLAVGFHSGTGDRLNQTI